MSLTVVVLQISFDRTFVFYRLNALLILNIKNCLQEKSAITTFGIRIQSVLDDSNIENNNVHETIISEVSPWTL